MTFTKPRQHLVTSGAPRSAQKIRFCKFYSKQQKEQQQFLGCEFEPRFLCHRQPGDIVVPIETSGFTSTRRFAVLEIPILLCCYKSTHIYRPLGLILIGFIYIFIHLNTVGTSFYNHLPTPLQCMRWLENAVKHTLTNRLVRQRDLLAATLSINHHQLSKFS